MAVQVFGRNYTGIYKPESVTDWLIGNTGDKQTLNLKIEVSAEFIANFSSTITINTDLQTITINSGGEWGLNGFDLNDNCILRYTHTTTVEDVETIEVVEIPFTIILDLGDTIKYTGGEGFGALDFALIPTDRGDEKITNVRVYSEKDFEGVKIQYGHIENETNESDNLTSIIDGSISEFGFVGLHTAPVNVFQLMDMYGEQSGMSIIRSRVRKLDSNTNLLATYTASNNNNLELATVKYSDGLGANGIQTSAIAFNIFSPSTPYHENITTQSNIPYDFNTSGGFVTTGYEGTIFLSGQPDGYEQPYNFNVSFAIDAILNNNTSSSPADTLKLMIYRYDAGLTFLSKSEIETWTNPASLIGTVINYNGSYTLFTNEGERYALVIEYEKKYTSFSGFSSKQSILRISNVSGTIDILNADIDPYKKIYEIEIDFIISSFYESVSNIENKEPPTYLQGLGSLTDNFKISFFPEWNNPNTVVVNDMSETRRLGNTGWFDENYNQLENEFTIESVLYTDVDGNIIDGIDYYNETNVQIKITGVNDINSLSRFGFGCSWLPQNEDDYKHKETPYYRNVFMSTGKTAGAYGITNTPDSTIFYGAGVEGAALNGRNVHFTNDNDELTLSVIFQPNAAYSALFDAKSEDNRNYILWVSLDDNNQTERNLSNRVTLLSDYNSFTKNLPVAGEYDRISNRFLEHPESVYGVGTTFYEGFVHDGVLSRCYFDIPKLSTTTFSAIEIGIVLFNSDQNTAIKLESKNIDFSAYPIDAQNVQQIDYESTRGFKLPNGDDKNFVKVQRNIDFDTDLYNAYVCLYAFKIRWEDWILNSDLPSSFFNADLPNNGYNNDWLTLLRNAGYEIAFYSEITVNESGDIYVYKNQFPFTFNDYDENPLIETAYNYYKHDDNTLLNQGTEASTGNQHGVILQEQKTRIEITYTIQDSGTWDTGNVYAITTIEIDNGSGINEQRQISSLKVSESDCPLIPVDGETMLSMSFDGTNKILTTVCLVDNNLINTGEKYRITGRVGCYQGGEEEPTGYRIYERAYEKAYK